MKLTIPLALLYPLWALYAVRSDTIREIEFRTYSQTPLREIAFHPVDAAAGAAGIRAAPPQTIQTHTRTRSAPYQFRGAGRLQFFDRQHSMPIGSVRLPRSSNRWLLVFMNNPHHLENPARQARYWIYPFDDSNSGLPHNRLVILNLSGTRLVGLVDNMRVQLSHGASHPLHTQASMRINLWMPSSNGAELLQALAQTYHFERNHRYLLILFPPVLSGSADVDARLLSQARPDTDSAQPTAAPLRARSPTARGIWPTSE
jgi:hypothetical protein